MKKIMMNETQATIKHRYAIGDTIYYVSHAGPRKVTIHGFRATLYFDKDGIDKEDHNIVYCGRGDGHFDTEIPEKKIIGDLDAYINKRIKNAARAAIPSWYKGEVSIEVEMHSFVYEDHDD